LCDSDNQYRRGHSYGRADSSSYNQPQALITALENGPRRCCSLLAWPRPRPCQNLVPGVHVVAAQIMYWGWRSWLKRFAEVWRLEVEFVDATPLDEFRRAVRPGRTRLVWVETPANPLWSVTDIACAAEIRSCPRWPTARRPHRY